PAVTLTPCRHRMRPPPHRPTRFPYTTLFRSAERQHVPRGPPERREIGRRQGGPPIMTKNVTLNVDGQQHTVNVDPDMPLLYALRSEEHTSELQSQSNLVCRLLLEKKKNVKNP